MEFRATETVFNEASVDLDFRIETDGAANKFFVDGGNNVVVIAATTPLLVRCRLIQLFKYKATLMLIPVCIN